MAGLVMSVKRSVGKPFASGFVLLVVLITLFLGEPLFSSRALIAADLLFYLDPLWQPLAPPGFEQPANQILSDQVFKFYPWQKFVRAEFLQGRVPLWNPYANSGHPLLGNAQAAPFDPFNLVALLWPLAKSFVVVAFLRLLCAGTFTLLLSLALGLSRFPAYLAMTVFTFALPQTVWLLYPKASVSVWLPALLYFSLRVMRTGKWRDVTLLALAMAAQLVGGHPETVLYSALVWLLFCAYWLWSQAHAPRAWAQLLAAGVLGLGAGAVQWLPVAEALLQSEILAMRGQSALNWQTILFGWRDWLAAATMLMPDFFGNPRHHDYWYPYSNYSEQTLYVGILPLALAILVGVRGRSRTVNFFVALAAIALAFALRLPFFPLIAELPGLSVTNPNRLRSVYMLAVALLSGYALEMVVAGVGERDSVGRRNMTLLLRILLILGGLAAAAALGALFVVTRFRAQLVELARSQAAAAQDNPFFFRPVEEYIALADVRVQQMIDSFLPSNWSMYWPLLVAVAFLTVWWALQRWAPPGKAMPLLAVFVIAITVADLWLFGRDYNPTLAPEQLYPTPPLVERLQERAALDAQPFRVVGRDLALAPNVGMVFGLEDVRGYDPISLRRYMALMNGMAGTVRVGHHLLFRELDAPVLDFLNVRYAFSNEPLSSKWEPLHDDNGVTLYANTNVLPRAFMVYTSRHATTPAESLAMTLAPDFDFRTGVVLEGDALPLEQPTPSRAPVVEINEYRPGAMTVEVTTDVAGVLVVSDPYAPGWVANVDGALGEILVANHAFRAVQVSAGQHAIQFRYRPLSFTVGVWISGVSLVALLLLLLFGRRSNAQQLN